MTLRDRIRTLLRRQRVTVSEAVQAPPPATLAAECPLSDCSTCRHSAAPLDVVAEMERALDAAASGPEVGRAFWWLLEAFPEVWTERSFARRLEVAERVARLQARARARRRVAL